MNNETRPEISEITETIVESDAGGGVMAFLSASLWGTGVGAGFWLALSLAVSDIPMDGFVVLGLFAFIAAFAIVALGMVAIMLPLTMLLTSANWERKSTYGMLAGISGGIVNLMMFSDGFFGDPWLYLVGGAAAGLAAGIRWGNWRKSKAQRNVSIAAGEQTPNPIHDLIY